MATTTQPVVQLDTEDNILLIDGSYFVFYRYYAVYNWIRFQDDKPATTLSAQNNDENTPTSSRPVASSIMSNRTFLDKYDKMFEKTLKDLVKKHGVSWTNVVFLKDCPRDDIFRMELFKEYKQERSVKDTFNGEIFRHTYDKLLPAIVSKYKMQILGMSRLEADDLVALIKEQVRRKNHVCPMVIVTNDNDYVQLYDSHTQIQNLQGKELKDRIPVPIDCYLQYKIIAGDKSDNIPPIKFKLGPKTAEKLALYPENLVAFLEKHPCAQAQYALNSQLINMDNIPDDLKTAVERCISLSP